MVVINKGATQAQVLVTLTEKLNLYPNSATGSYYLYIVNDLTYATYSIPDLIDISPNSVRDNIFNIDETSYNFKNGRHTYYFYTTPTSGDLLELGTWLVVGTSSVDPIYK